MKEKRFFGWTLVALLFFIYLVNTGFVAYGASISNAYMAKEFGISATAEATGYTLDYLFFGLAGLLAAWFIGKKGTKLCLYLGTGLMLVGCLIMAWFVKGVIAYYVVFGVILGVAQSFGTLVPCNTVVAQWFNRKKALATGCVIIAGGVGGFFVTNLTTVIINAFDGNWRAGWYFAAILAAIGLIAVYFVKEKPADIGQTVDGLPVGGQELPDRIKKVSDRVYITKDDFSLHEAVKTSSFWFVAVGAIAMVFPLYYIIPMGTVYLTEKGMTMETAAMGLSLVALFSVISRLLGGWLGDIIDPRYVVSIGTLLGGLGCIVASLANDAGLVYLYNILIGLGYGFCYVSLMTLASNFYGTKHIQTLTSILALLALIFGAAAPTVGGLMQSATGSYTPVWLMMTAISVVAAILMSIARPPVRKAKSQEHTAENIGA